MRSTAAVRLASFIALIHKGFCFGITIWFFDYRPGGDLDIQTQFLQTGAAHAVAAVLRRQAVESARLNPADVSKSMEGLSEYVLSSAFLLQAVSVL